MMAAPCDIPTLVRAPAPLPPHQNVFSPCLVEAIPNGYEVCNTPFKWIFVYCIWPQLKSGWGTERQLLPAQLSIQRNPSFWSCVRCPGAGLRWKLCLQMRARLRPPALRRVGGDRVACWARQWVGSLPFHPCLYQLGLIVFVSVRDIPIRVLFSQLNILFFFLAREYNDCNAVVLSL